MAALLGVLVFDTLPGLFIGIAMSLVLLLYRASRPNIAVLGRTPDGRWVDLEREDDAKPQPGVAVLRVEAGLFFANADHVRDAIRAHASEDGVKAVVLDAETVPDIDVTAAEMLLAAARRPRARRACSCSSRATSARSATCCAARAPRTTRSSSLRRGRRQPSPLIPSPISFAPMTRQSTAMIAVLLAPIHAFISSSSFVARSPSAK